MSIYHEVEGRQVVRVTACLPFERPPGMTEEQMEVARERGATVHEITEMLDRGVLDESSVDVDLEGYVEAWKRCKTEWGIRILLNEHRVYSKKYDYAGTLDRDVVLYSGHSRAIIDLKTGPIMATAPLQLAAYAQALGEEHPRMARRRRIAVQLMPDGQYRSKEFYDNEDIYEFLAKLRSLRWDIKNGYLKKVLDKHD